MLVERHSRTTYRPTVTPNRSTHVNTFTGTTSSFSRTVSEKVAAVAVACQPVLRRLLGRKLQSHSPQCRGRVVKDREAVGQGWCSTNETTAATAGHHERAKLAARTPLKRLTFAVDQFTGPVRATSFSTQLSQIGWPSRTTSQTRAAHDADYRWPRRVRRMQSRRQCSCLWGELAYTKRSIGVRARE